MPSWMPVAGLGREPADLAAHQELDPQRRSAWGTRAEQGGTHVPSPRAAVPECAWVDSARWKHACLARRDHRFARSACGVAIARGWIAGSLSAYDLARSRRGAVHAGMGARLVADEVVERILCTALEERRARVSQFRGGHAGRRLPVIRRHTGKAASAKWAKAPAARRTHDSYSGTATSWCWSPDTRKSGAALSRHAAGVT